MSGREALDLGDPGCVTGLILRDRLRPAYDSQQLRRAGKAQLAAHQLHELLVLERPGLRVAGAADQGREKHLAARRALGPEGRGKQGAQYLFAGP